jgi:DNA-binding transcriptional LysR family regulator
LLGIVVDLNALATFVHVVKAGSFAAAGRKLGVPANTLSRRVQELEESLGVRLLLRSTRKLNLTTAGARLFAQCADGITELEQAGSSLQQDMAEPAGTVRATAPADFFHYFPLALLAEFMARHPKVQVEFLLADSRVDIVDESIDVAFRAGKLEGATLVARKLADSTRGLFASPAFLTRHGAPEAIERLTGMECITAPSLSGSAVWQLNGPQGEVQVSVSGRFRANTAQVRALAARAGLGIAFLPLTLAQQGLVDGSLVRVLPEFGYDVGGFYAVSPSRRLRSPAVSALIDFVAEQLNTLLES